MRKALSRRSFLHTYLLLGVAAGASQKGSRIRAPRNQPVKHGAGIDAAESTPIQSIKEQELFRLRVVSLNVWALPIVSKDTPARLAAIVRRLAELNADIVGLQEAWMEEARQSIIDDAREASDLRHHYYFKPGIRDSGLLILSRFPIREVGFHRFRLSGRPERLAEAEYVAGKGIGYVRLQTPVSEVDVYNFHLLAQYTTDEQDPYRAHRTAAAYEMVKFVSSQSRERNPVLLLGDLNMRPDQLGYKILTCTGGFRDSYLSVNPENAGHTISGLNPYTRDEDLKRIDYIFTKDGTSVGLNAVMSRVIMDERPPVVDGRELAAYSDHYGVLSEIELFPRSSPGDAAEGRCGPASAIWTEFLSYIDAALQEARIRQMGHHVKGLGGAVAAPGLYFFGRGLKSLATARNAPTADTAVAPTEENPDQGGDELNGIDSRRQMPLRRRVFLARLVQGIAVAVMTPYAMLHGWLGLWIVPDEIRELEAIRDELLLQTGVGHGGR
ncbi:MAG: endonuclease/exonuclease/phosphatase family protein [Chloroflexota bacterium]|nr:endonuclease/exonuclease/phosphatase family protein [Chloroflexota bacterium]